jgi:hypothetical protein
VRSQKNFAKTLPATTIATPADTPLTMTGHIEGLISGGLRPSASKRPASGNGLIQKKKKRDKYRAAEQDRPVPYIKAKIPTCAANALGPFLGWWPRSGGKPVRGSVGRRGC